MDILSVEFKLTQIIWRRLLFFFWTQNPVDYSGVDHKGGAASLDKIEVTNKLSSCDKTVKGNASFSQV